MITSPLILDHPPGLQDLLVSSRRYLHEHPEIGFQEFETSRFIWNTLESHGFEVKGPVAGTGLYIEIEGHEPGPFIGYRADIDALPTPDAKHVSYASKNAGVAHLCGHDVHTTVAIGVALLLNANRDAFSGKVRIYFQPNEEGNPSGAPRMIEHGILEGLEATYAIHVDPTLFSGKYGVIKGPATAAAVRFKIAITSPSTGHSARPHEAIDTVWTATQIANELYQMAGRLTDPRDATILTICRFQAGEADNVIPAYVELGGTLRCTSLETRRKMQQLINGAAQMQAQLVGATAEVTFDEGIPPVLNDARLVDLITDTIEDIYGKDAVYQIPRPSMGAEDFANYQLYIPGVLLRIGTSSNDRTSYPLHDAHFDIDETTMAPTAQLMTQVLINHLNKKPLG